MKLIPVYTAGMATWLLTCRARKQVGNPLGRPQGSRNRLSEDFPKALADDFELHGAQAIQDVRENSPKDYMKCICSILHKGLE